MAGRTTVCAFFIKKITSFKACRFYTELIQSQYCVVLLNREKLSRPLEIVLITGGTYNIYPPKLTLLTITKTGFLNFISSAGEFTG